jgi:hypothetical protein
MASSKSVAVLVRSRKIKREADKRTPVPAQPEIMIHPSSGLIAQALRSLMNNSVTTVLETKTGSSKAISFNLEVLAVMRGLFRSDLGYRFQVHQSGTASTTAVGVLAVSVPINNTTGPTIAEWAALAALFDEVKAVKTRLGITSAYSTLPPVTTKNIPYAIAFDHVNSSASAPGFGNVQRLAESKFVNATWMDAGSGRHIQTARISPTRLFGITSAPTSTSSDIGLNGEWYVVGQDTGNNSNLQFYFDVESVFLFRNRA